MLVLTRKTGGAIVIGDITVTVVKIVGKQVRIGIEAPREVKIVRQELADADVHWAQMSAAEDVVA